MTKKIDETWDKSKPLDRYLPVARSRILAVALGGGEVAFGRCAGSQA